MQLGRQQPVTFDDGHIAPEVFAPSLVEDPKASSTVDPLLPTPKEWDFILMNGAYHQTFSPGTVIVAEGDTVSCIYHITKGECRVEKNTDVDGDPVLLGTLTEGSAFGEMSFLEGSKATAQIVAEVSGAEVYILEVSVLKVLFSLLPDLGAKFFRYIAGEQYTKLKQKQTAVERL